MAKKIIQLLIFLSLGIFFVWFSVKDLSPEDVDKIKESAKGVLNSKSLFFIFISMACGVVAHYFRALRNILLIDPLGYRVRKSTAFYSVMTCYLANLAVPRLGEVLRCSILQRYDQVPFQKSFGTVVVDRVFDLMVFFALFVLIIFLNTGLLSNLMINKQEGITLGAWVNEKWAALWAMKYLVFGAFIGLVVLLLILKHIRTTRQTDRKQSKIIGKIKNIFVGLWQGLISVKDLKRPYLFVIYTIGIWVFYYLGIYMCFFAFDFLQNLGFMPAFLVMVVGTIGFIIAQGGLGAYPLIVAGVLALYGIDYAQGLAAGWIGWGAQQLMVLVVGFTTLILASFLKIEDRSV
ncbi:MAG: flippase-like domain-containing protein [Bacteroidetes bacterium]|nr:flippase-like domain-containing protein [Bacteroidota bacterium]MCL2302458.1 flippase-like domain-containing protein [Lentimicrobiaceae bacterium]